MNIIPLLLLFLFGLIIIIIFIIYKIIAPNAVYRNVVGKKWYWPIRVT